MYLISLYSHFVFTMYLMFSICDSWTGLAMNVTLLKFIDFPRIGSVGIFDQMSHLLTSNIFLYM